VKYDKNDENKKGEIVCG